MLTVTRNVDSWVFLFALKLIHFMDIISSDFTFQTILKYVQLMCENSYDTYCKLDGKILKERKYSIQIFFFIKNHSLMAIFTDFHIL